MSDQGTREVVDQAQALLDSGQDVHAIVDGFDQNLAVGSIGLSGTSSVRIVVADSAVTYVVQGDRLIGVKAAAPGSAAARITGF